MPLKQRFECGRCGSEVKANETFYEIETSCTESKLTEGAVDEPTQIVVKVTIGECCKPTIDALIAKMKSGRKARKPRVKPAPKSRAPNTTGNDFKGRRGETVTA